MTDTSDDFQPIEIDPPAEIEKRLIDEPRYAYAVGYFQKTIGVDDNIGFFSFNPAVEIRQIVVDRCDLGWWGPTSFHTVTNGACDCGNIDSDSSTSEVCQYGVSTLNSIRFSCPFLSDPPHGYICYQEMEDSSVEDAFCAHHWNGNARTLQELFKLMYEWRDCHLLLNDNSRIATVAHDFLTSLDVPAEIEQWVRNEMPDGPVLRYLSGDESARERPVGIPDMPDNMSHWLWTKVNGHPMSYGSLGNQIKVESA